MRNLVLAVQYKVSVQSEYFKKVCVTGNVDSMWDRYGSHTIYIKEIDVLIDESSR
ncbi:MAG: hypothetical protein ACJAS1_007274 [Oleiphilaceae bacterium]|jgi:hypothetical protein